jgi:hypothetical protein
MQPEAYFYDMGEYFAKSEGFRVGDALRAVIV